MTNIVKSIIYEVIRSRLLIFLFLIMAGVNVLVTVLNIAENTFKEATTSAMLSEAHNTVFMFAEFFVVAAVGIICGSDFKDKVANYEILNGHSRIKIYLARSISAVFIASILGAAISFVPLVSGNIFFDFGSRLELGDVIIRTALLFFPYLRLAAFAVILTFVIKNQYAVMGISYGIIMFNTLMSGIVTNHDNLLTANFNLNLLADYEGWTVYNISKAEGIVNYAAYDSSLPMWAVTGTIFVSLAVMLVYLVIGYGLFRRDELN